ncbi:UNKNOWN [Stylonychia lemnae]|uniref:Transmembrane protein n=1 Tax=Stylonychia lemnae TaxID=5949 RepID=A0A078A4F5_STYLE|nr:UNKNOWN [Stylonychia lemnae]|eukprot:CDW77138.1 UNKNOWN [Stylonychia lemnae]
MEHTLYLMTLHLASINYYADTFNFTQQDDEENLDEKPPLQDFILVIICFGVGIIGIILVIVAFRYTQCGRRVCFNQRNENNINRDIREQGLGDGIIVVRRGSNIQVQNLDNRLNEILKLAPQYTYSQVKQKDQLQQTCCVICLGEYMNENKVIVKSTYELRSIKYRSIMPFLQTRFAKGQITQKKKRKQ